MITVPVLGDRCTVHCVQVYCRAAAEFIIITLILQKVTINVLKVNQLTKSLFND